MNDRFRHWELAVDAWCLRHGITRRQAASLLLESNSGMSSLLDWAESQEFLARLAVQEKLRGWNVEKQAFSLLEVEISEEK